MDDLKEQLRNQLMPMDSKQTRGLVRDSGLAQLEKFIQLISLISSRVPDEQFKEQAETTFQQYEDEPADVFYRRLASPIFRGWLSLYSQVKDFFGEQGEDVVLQIQLANWNNMRYSFLAGEYETTMRVVNGLCVCWDPRICFRVGRRERVTVSRRNGNVTIGDADNGDTLLEIVTDSSGLVQHCYAAEGCSVHDAPRLADSQIVVRNDLPWLQLKLSNTGQRDTGVVLGELDHSEESYSPFESEPFIAASQILQRCWPSEFSDFKETLQVVVPRNAPSGWNAFGMTVSTHQGGIWILARGLVRIYEHMVHEQSHVKLRYVEEKYPILAADQTHERFPVGWRSDPRPIDGIYEGVYVNLHVLVALDSALQDGAFNHKHAIECENRIDELRLRVDEALAILKQHGRFTEAGQVMIDWAEETLAGFPGGTFVTALNEN